jgi:hypothetical protein
MSDVMKKFPTKKQMHALKECITNSWNLAELTDQKVFISWAPQIVGRWYRPANFAVVHIGHKTDPKGHWQNDGHKSFYIYDGDTRDSRVLEAIAWADKKFGKRTWVRDPFGSYQDLQALNCVWDLVKESK